mmetsp:Transcript_10304/g.29408  ORF Transcript_10304/g.29408 Transcript_10304/m.29408 type:complete len:176 (-) Transcript_10304:94-621(-)
MIHFVQTYMAFATIDVLGPRWQAMADNIRGAKTIDEVVLLHEHFLEKALSGCLLIDAPILKQLANLKLLCLNFCSRMSNLGLGVRDEDPTEAAASTSHHTRARKQVQVLLAEPGWAASIQRQHSEFVRGMNALLAEVRERSKEPNKKFLEHLANRLDESGFYHKQLLLTMGYHTA